MTQKTTEPQARFNYVKDPSTGCWVPDEKIPVVFGWTTLFSRDLINATAVIRSAPLYVEWMTGYFSLYWEAISASGGVDLLIQYEVGRTLTDTFVVPDGAANIVTNMITEVARAISIQPIPTNYLKIKVTGNAANSADTLLSMSFYAK